MVGRPRWALAVLVPLALYRPAADEGTCWCSSPEVRLRPWTPTSRGFSSRIARRATDPNFRANVGEAVDTLRSDHGNIPLVVPGLTVADPWLALSIAGLPALRFEGVSKYREFWDNFRTAVGLVSVSSSSEVVNIVHSGLYVRIRWRLLLAPRAPPGGEAAAGVFRTARDVLDGVASGTKSVAGGALNSGFGGWLRSTGDGLLGEAEKWASGSAPRGPGASRQPSLGDRVVELNSIYELDCWSGRVTQHTLEFRSPTEDFDILGAMQGVPSFR